MKKIFFIGLISVMILSACTSVSEGDKNDVANPKADIEIGCSVENPPTIYEDTYNRAALDLCGEKTGYIAVEFKEHSMILFTDADFTSENPRALKIISTIAPFEIEDIATIPHGYSIYSTDFKWHYDSQNGWYTQSYYGEMCGASYNLFAFSPEMKEFILGGHYSDLCGNTPIKFISSSGKFTARDIQLIGSVHEQFKYDNAHAFDELCGPLDTYGRKNIIEGFSQGFPDKIYCYEDIWLPDDEKSYDPVGYFDLVNDKFEYLEHNKEVQDPFTIEGDKVTVNGENITFRFLDDFNIKDNTIEFGPETHIPESPTDQEYTHPMFKLTVVDQKSFDEISEMANEKSTIQTPITLEEVNDLNIARWSEVGICEYYFYEIIGENHNLKIHDRNYSSDDLEGAFNTLLEYIE